MANRLRTRPGASLSLPRGPLGRSRARRVAAGRSPQPAVRACAEFAAVCQLRRGSREHAAGGRSAALGGERAGRQAAPAIRRVAASPAAAVAAAGPDPQGDHADATRVRRRADVDGAGSQGAQSGPERGKKRARNPLRWRRAARRFLPRVRPEHEGSRDPGVRTPAVRRDSAAVPERRPDSPRSPGDHDDRRSLELRLEPRGGGAFGLLAQGAPEPVPESPHVLAHHQRGDSGGPDDLRLRAFDARRWYLPFQGAVGRRSRAALVGVQPGRRGRTPFGGPPRRVIPATHRVPGRRCRFPSRTCWAPASPDSIP